MNNGQWVSGRSKIPHTLPRLIGLAGFARSGKDTVGKILDSDYNFYPVSFATPLKTLVVGIDPFIHNEWRVSNELEYWSYFSDPISPMDKAKEHLEVRRLLQETGTQAREILGENIWVDTAMKGLYDEWDYVFTDVRFPNEADAIRSRGGLVIRVERPSVGAINNHVSETALADYEFDGIILNDGSIPELEHKVRSLFNQLGFIA